MTNRHDKHPRTSREKRPAFRPTRSAYSQDRLSSALSADPTLNLRLRTLLATGVLALFAGLTSTSVASEPDHQQEGVVAPQPGTPSPDRDASLGGDFSEDEIGSGGVDDTLLTEVPGVAPGPIGVDDPYGERGPVETEPLDDPDYPDPVPDASQPEGTTTNPSPQPESTPTGPPPNPDTAPTPQSDASPVDDRQRPDATKPQPPARHRTKRGRPSPRDRQPLPQSDPPAVTPAVDEPEAAAPSTTTVEPTPQAPAVKPLAGAIYTVRPGDSLWSIATRLLARHGDASAADMAQEVARLWALNADRIGTGDPNLLPVGVVLRLR
jgi:LysM repeat protein